MKSHLRLFIIDNDSTVTEVRMFRLPSCSFGLEP